MLNLGKILKDSLIPYAPQQRISESEEQIEYEFESNVNDVNNEVIPGSRNKPLKLEAFDDFEPVNESTREKRLQYADTTSRSLLNRHIQLIGVGGTIGTGLFVTIASALVSGGGAGLLTAYSFWCIIILFITISTAEMVCYLPIASPFVRLAGRCCDEALEVMAGWNFWFLECALIPFEITAVNTIIHYWRDDYSPAIPLAIQVLLYFVINVFGVALYGETEFWLSIGKVLLSVMLMVFTLVTMCGGNPKHDKFGFRNWSIDPFNEAITSGPLGRFEGWLGALISACYMIAGPEYVSMAAGEVINPRKNLPSAFKQVFYRLTFFFIGGCLCIATLVAPNDPLLINALSEGSPGAGSSPYVIAMTNLNIKIFPHIVNALLVTASFSAGNSYTYCSSRALFGMALEGKAPKFLAYTTKTGVPVYCVLISLCWAMLSFLQLSENSAVVLDWIINLITSCQLINYVIICVTYTFFFKALKFRNIDRNSLPFKGWYQPWLAIIAGVAAFIMTFVTTYTVFLPGNWSINTFLFEYVMIFADIVIFVGWKLIKRTKWKKIEEIDIFTGLKEIEDHEASYYAHLATLENGKTEDGTSWYRPIARFLWGG